MQVRKVSAQKLLTGEISLWGRYSRDLDSEVRPHPWACCWSLSVWGHISYMIGWGKGLIPGTPEPADMVFDIEVRVGILGHPTLDQTFLLQTDSYQCPQVLKP